MHAGTLARACTHIHAMCTHADQCKRSALKLSQLGILVKRAFTLIAEMQFAESLAIPLEPTISPWNYPFIYKDVPVRAVVVITCILSILGAFLIILCYCLFKKLCTIGGTILVHLSIMDIGVALPNLVGVVVYFDQFYIMSTSLTSQMSPQPLISCVTHRLFVEYISPLEWTASLAVYLYFRIVHSVGTAQLKVIFWLCCVFSYL